MIRIAIVLSALQMESMADQLLIKEQQNTLPQLPANQINHLVLGIYF
jgi:hypothetical protein